MIKKFFLLFVILGGVATVGWWFLGRGELTEHEKQALYATYVVCERDVDKAANELEKWYLSYTMGPTEHAAEELIGWKAKWKRATGTKEECEKYSNEVMRRYLFSEKDAVQHTAEQIGAVLLAWRDAEDQLALETGCSELSSQTKTQRASGAGISKPPEEILKNECLNTVYREVVSMVGGEVAAVAVTQLAISAGILGTGTALSWETFGIGLGVGIVVDAVVSWFMDSEGKIREILDKQVRGVAARQKDIFRAGMLKLLHARRTEWEKQLQ